MNLHELEDEIKRIWIEMSKMEGRINKECDRNTENKILKTEENIRVWAKKEYAIKLIESIVFSGLGFVLIAVLGAIITLVIRK